MRYQGTTFDLAAIRSTGVFLLTAIPILCQTPSPFTAIEVSRQFDAAGTIKSESRFLFAMNRDGSIVSVDLDPNTSATRQIIDVTKRETILINPNTQSATISPYGGFAAGSPRTCDERFRFVKHSVISVDTPAATIHGVAVERISIKSLNGVMSEIFLAPSLACHTLRSLTMRNGRSFETQAAENVQLGDPDPRLFDIPSDYCIVNIAAPNQVGCAQAHK